MLKLTYTLHEEDDVNKIIIITMASWHYTQAVMHDRVKFIELYHGQHAVLIPLLTNPCRDVLRNNADWLPKVITLRARLLKTFERLYGACRTLSTRTSK